MDELDISGKRYLSTRRAGRENGYHSDYIGQLIRGGKIAGQKVGRSWYVEAESLARYLGKESARIVEVEQTLPKQIKLEEERPELPVEKVIEPVENNIAISFRQSTPVKITKNFLTYEEDYQPLLPEIRKAPSTEEDKLESLVQREDTHQTPVAEKNNFWSSWSTVMGVVVVGLAVLIVTTLLSSSLTSRVRVQEGQPASAEFVFE